MEDTNILRYWLALHKAPQVGAILFEKLHRRYPNLEDLFKEPESSLHALKLPKELIHYLKNPNWQAVEYDLDWQNQSGHSIIHWRSPDYPESLKMTEASPPLLYIKGDPKLLAKPQIAMVGSRNPTPMGIDMAFSFAKNLAENGFIITSGLALGIDAASHRGALAANQSTIAVMGTGLNHIYPKRHQKLAEEILQNGAIISEFPLDVPAIASNFPQRNRIISGLSKGVMVVEATLKSGSLITAKYALEQGREIFTMPSSIHNPLAKGCHQLLRQGAKLVEQVNDIIEEISPQLVDKTEIYQPKNRTKLISTLALDYQQLLECLNFAATPIDIINARIDLPEEKITSMLIELELDGLIARIPGGFVRLV